MEYIEVSIRITLPSEVSSLIKQEKDRFVTQYGSSYKSEPHITLYLHRYTEEGVFKLSSDLRELALAPFSFSLLKPEIIDEGHRNLYVIDVSNKEKLIELHERISTVASHYQSDLLREKDQKRLEQGLSIEPRTFVPHITLGEVASDASQPDLIEVRKNLADLEGKEILVSGITLFFYGKEKGEAKGKLFKEIKTSF